MSFFGFIPCRDNDASDHTELRMATEALLAWEIDEAWELNAAMKRAQHALFKEIDRHASLLELLDPENWSAAQELANVLIALSEVNTGPDRLCVLTMEARRLMCAVAEAKRKRLVRTRLMTTAVVVLHSLVRRLRRAAAMDRVAPT